KRLGIDAQTEEGFPLPKWSVDEHLKFMDDADVDFTVLSMATPHIYNGADKEKISCEVAREINLEFASICRHYPDKFGFVATLPMPSVEGSIAEIKFAMEQLGALGVKVASNSDGVYLGDERLDPIFAELNSRKALVILHPSPAKKLPREGVVTGKVMAMYEYPADTTRAVLNLLSNGTLKKFPSLKFVVPHCGSFLPYMKQRAGAMFQMLSAMKIMDAVDVAAGLKNLYFDLAGDPMPEQMEMLLKISDVDHLIYGSDYPYVPAQVWLKKKSALDAELVNRRWTEKIYIENAKKILE
ncbi:MAG: amidohydrolase, partial [Selenomonadaceae bacterium]|nr:amidohydrolase [Selenomonadaceae bacterium]